MKYLIQFAITGILVAGCGNNSYPPSEKMSNRVRLATLTTVSVQSDDYTLAGDTNPRRSHSVSAITPVLATAATVAGLADEARYNCPESYAHPIPGTESCAICNWAPAQPEVELLSELGCNADFTAVQDGPECQLDTAWGSRAAHLTKVAAKFPLLPTPETLSFTSLVRVSSDSTLHASERAWSGGEPIDFTSKYEVANDSTGTEVDGSPTSVPAPRYLVFSGATPKSGDVVQGSRDLALAWVSPSGAPGASEQVRVVLQAKPASGVVKLSAPIGVSCLFTSLTGQATFPAAAMASVPKGEITTIVQSLSIGTSTTDLGPDVNQNPSTVRLELSSTVRDAAGAALERLVVQ